tara:strand:+ start:1684 stop:2607 length:924 start_codon:yes stop_codon:yes gene_type:complete
MAKYSNDAVELGASRVPAIVLGKTSFTTNERERQKTLHARQGIETIETDFGKDAKERGNYLEDAIIKWARDKVADMSLSAKVELCKVTQGYRIDELALCASLDAILNIEGQVTMHNQLTGEPVILSGFGALEIKTTNTDDLPRTDQIIQLQTQLLCSGFKWGIIAVFGKAQKLTLVPFEADKDIFNQIMEKVTEFWQKVDLDEPYPPLDNGPPSIINLDHLDIKDSLIGVAEDWLMCDAEIKKWTKKKEEDQKLLQRIMEQNEAEYAEVGNINIAYPTITRKAQPEKIVPAKEATYYRKFKIEKKEN